MRCLSVVLALVVSLAIVGNLSAEEKKAKKKGKRPEQRESAGQNQLMRLFKSLDLSTDQIKKVQALWNGYSPKFKIIGKKQRNILTSEQKKAMAEAREKAIKEGKKRHEVFQAAQKAVTLTDEQKAAFEECRTERQELYREMIGKALEILTPAQREIIKRKLKRFQNSKPGEKPRKGKPDKKKEKKSEGEKGE